jgi:branched-subunit amino acid transport protein
VNFWIFLLLTALGTYLMRWLPLQMGAKLLSGPTWLTQMLRALGVTAMSALVVVSVVDVWRQIPTTGTLLSVALGGIVTLLALRLSRNVGVAAIVGALCYGVAMAALA